MKNVIYTCVYKITAPNKVKVCVFKSINKTYTKTSSRVHGIKQTCGAVIMGTAPDSTQGRAVRSLSMFIV